MSMHAKILKKWLFFLVICWLAGSSFSKENSVNAQVFLNELPYEAQQCLALIKRGGPFPYEKDGVVFANYERRLPIQPRGYYHEYTVTTPRSHSRGARRIIAGGRAATSGEYYYTGDHYQSFRRIKE